MMLFHCKVHFTIWGRHPIGGLRRVGVSARGRGTSPLDWSPRGAPWSQATSGVIDALKNRPNILESAWKKVVSFRPLVPREPKANSFFLALPEFGSILKSFGRPIALRRGRTASKLAGLSLPLRLYRNRQRGLALWWRSPPSRRPLWGCLYEEAKPMNQKDQRRMPALLCVCVTCVRKTRVMSLNGLFHITPRRRISAKLPPYVKYRTVMIIASMLSVRECYVPK